MPAARFLEPVWRSPTPVTSLFVPAARLAAPLFTCFAPEDTCESQLESDDEPFFKVDIPLFT